MTLRLVTAGSGYDVERVRVAHDRFRRARPERPKRPAARAPILLALDRIGAALEAIHGELGRAAVPTRLLTREQAAQVVGVSMRSFERHVEPHLARVPVGARHLIPVAVVERWIEESVIEPPVRAR